MILFFVTGTLAAIDWSLSINSGFFSNIWGWLAISRQALGAMALMLVVVLGLIWKRESLSHLTQNVRVVADLGTILLVTLLAWIYMNFIQYIVIWSGNLPSKAIFYTDRTAGNWQGFLLFVVIFHAIPFVGLMMPGLKRMRMVMVTAAVWLLVMRLVEMVWVIMPAFEPNFVLRWWDIMLPLAMGGLWVTMFLWTLEQNPLVPENHPYYQEALHHAKSHGHGEEQYETA
jgi:hypothetical protein